MCVCVVYMFGTCVCFMYGCVSYIYVCVVCLLVCVVCVECIV